METMRVRWGRWLKVYQMKALEPTYKKKVRRAIIQLSRYVVLLALSFIFVLPVLYMVATSFKSLGDLLDTTVVWLPNEIYWPNFEAAASGLHLETSFRNTLIVAVFASIGQIVSCSIAGYGFGRFRFPGHGLLFVLLLLSLLIPPQTIIISLFALFQKLGWLNSYWPFVVPAFFAQGLRGALFVLIFSQFFRNLPRELEEAARMDGAGPLKLFFVIMLPLARPALFLVGLFSFVWHWNDDYEPSLYLNSDMLYTLPLRLISLKTTPETMNLGSQAKQSINEPIIMAACLIVVVPLLILYLFAQRYLKGGIERSGFGGE